MDRDLGRGGEGAVRKLGMERSAEGAAASKARDGGGEAGAAEQKEAVAGDTEEPGSLRR